MTRSSSIRRAAEISKPWPTVIGRFHVGGQSRDFAVSEADLKTDARFWAEVLRGYGFESGSRIVVSAFNYEMPWTYPVRRAAALLGGSYSNVEHWGWDARRLAQFCRQLEPTVLFGVGRENLEGLGNIVDLGEALAPVEHLLVRPDALDYLAEAGLTPSGVVTWIGPAAAVTLSDGSGIAIDETQWKVESVDGVLHVSTRADRAAVFDREATSVRGGVEQTSAGVRIHLDELV